MGCRHRLQALMSVTGGFSVGLEAYGVGSNTSWVEYFEAVSIIRMQSKSHVMRVMHEAIVGGGFGYIPLFRSPLGTHCVVTDLCEINCVQVYQDRIMHFHSNPGIHSNPAVWVGWWSRVERYLQLSRRRDG